MRETLTTHKAQRMAGNHQKCELYYNIYIYIHIYIYIYILRLDRGEALPDPE